MSNDDQTLKSSELSMLLFGSNAALPTTEESQKSNPLLLQKKKHQKESIELSDMDAAQASQLLKEKHAIGKLAADGKDKGVMRHRRKVHRSYHQIDSLEKQSAILRQQVFQLSAEDNEYQDDLDVKVNDKKKLQCHQEDEEDEEFQIRSNRVPKQAKTEDMVLHRKSDEHDPSFNAKKDDLSDATSEASTRKRRRHRRRQSSSSSSSNSSVPRRRRRRRMAEDSSDSDSDSSYDSIDKRRSKARAKARAKSRQLNSKETLRKQSSSSSSSDRDNSSDLPRHGNGQLPFIQNSETDLQPMIKKGIIHDTQPCEKKKQMHSSSSSSSSSLSSSSSSDEEDVKPMMSLSKPLFVPKHKRNNIKEKEQQEEMEQTLQRRKEEEVQNRIRTSRALVAQVVAAEVQERELIYGGDQNEFAETGGTTMPPPDDNDNLNDDDVEMERKAWEVRELLRLLREFEVIIHDYEESKELERRRNMTDDERYKEDVAAGRYKKPGEKDGNSNVSYMQRYHHRGAFYMDDDTLKDKDDVRQKAAQYSRAATGEDNYDRRLMPKVMQVKRPGFANQTRYKGLKHEDTSDKTIQYLPTKVDHHRMSNMRSDQQK